MWFVTLIGVIVFIIACNSAERRYDCGVLKIDAACQEVASEYEQTAARKASIEAWRTKYAKP